MRTHGASGITSSTHLVYHINNFKLKNKTKTQQNKDNLRGVCVCVSTLLAMSERFIAFGLCHHGLSFEFVCDLVVTTSYEQIRVRKPNLFPFQLETESSNHNKKKMNGYLTISWLVRWPERDRSGTNHRSHRRRL